MPLYVCQTIRPRFISPVSSSFHTTILIFIFPGEISLLLLLSNWIRIMFYRIRCKNYSNKLYTPLFKVISNSTIYLSNFSNVQMTIHMKKEKYTHSHRWWFDGEGWTTIPFYFKLPLLRWFEIFLRLASLRQFGYLRSPPLLCMIYGRSYHKSGYWNFNIRYNRPSPTTTTPSLPNSHRSPFFRLGFHTPNFLPAPLRKSERKRSHRFECVFIRVIFQFWKSIGRKRSGSPSSLTPSRSAQDTRYKLHMSPPSLVSYHCKRSGGGWASIRISLLHAFQKFPSPRFNSLG